MIRWAGGAFVVGCEPGVGAYLFGGGAPDGGAVNGEGPLATGGCIGVGSELTDCCCCGGAYAFWAVDPGRLISGPDTCGDWTRGGGISPALGGGGTAFCVLPPKGAPEEPGGVD